MANMQFSMTEKQYQYAKALIRKNKAKFTIQFPDKNWTNSMTLITILEEYSKEKGFISQTASEQQGVSQKALINHDPEEMEFVRELIQKVKKNPTSGSLRQLHEYILRVDPNWHFVRSEPMNEQVLRKAMQEFGG